MRRRRQPPAPTHVQRDTRHVGERRSLAQGHAQLRPDVERLPTRRERVLVLRGHVALVRVQPQELGAFRGRQAAGEPQRARVLGGGLAVRADRRCAGSGRRRELEHRVGVARRLCVMREPREVGAWPPVRSSSAASVARWRASFRSGAARLLDGEPRELVAERDASRSRSTSIPDGEAFVERREGVRRRTARAARARPAAARSRRPRAAPARRA